MPKDDKVYLYVGFKYPCEFHAREKEIPRNRFTWLGSDIYAVDGLRGIEGPKRNPESKFVLRFCKGYGFVPTQQFWDMANARGFEPELVE